MRRRMIAGVMWLLLVLIVVNPLRAAEPAKGEALSSWNDGPSKKTIIDFVERVTRDGGPDYVKPEDRIATFDHDCTLWA